MSAPGPPSRWRVPLVFTTYLIVFYGILPVGLWLFGRRIDQLLSLPPVEAPAIRVGGLALAGLGVWWMAWSIWVLRRWGKGWPISHLPPTTLVREGPYGVTPHPVYVGYTAAFAGLGLAAGSLGVSVHAAGLLAFGATTYALGFEGPRLRRRFGDSYPEYLHAVRLRRAVALVSCPFAAVWAALRPGAEWLANRVVLFRAGSLIVVSYGLLTALGAAIMASVLVRLFRAGGMPTELAGWVLPALGIMTVLGSRVAWLGYQWRALLRQPRATLRRVGFVSWGGVAAMLLMLWSVAATAGLDPRWLFDCLILSVLAGYPVARLGCLTYGCCYGRPSDHGIHWTHPEAKVIRERGPAGAVGRVPTQLLSSLVGLLVVAGLVLVVRRAPPPGTVAGLGLFGYAAGRFAADGLRDEPRLAHLDLTRGQVGALVAALAGMAFLFMAGGDSRWDAPLRDMLAQERDVSPLPVLVAAGLVFLGFGVHWGRVGRW